jgi:hypothetical protein
MNLTSRLSLSSCLLAPILCCSCKHDSTTQPLFTLMENTGVHFENKVTDGKLENSFLFRNFYNGGGVAIGDLNNDGLADIVLTSNMGDNKIYLNKGGFKFDDITAGSHLRQDSMWSTGVTLVDINNDGWLDIYICNSGHMGTGHRKNQLYINNHDLTFTESAAKYGLDISAYCTQVSFFDYDMDGDLDCFMIDNSPIPINTLNNANRRDLPDADWPIAPFLKGGGDHLYRNDNGHFTEVTRQAGIHGSLISFGLGVCVGDINGDGYPDVFVSNDSYERDYLYINQRDGTFKDELEDWMQHTSFSSMGADLADINNDGYPDLFTTDMLPDDDYRLRTMGSFDNIDLYNGKVQAGFYHQYVKNCLQLNNRHGKFADIANYSGVSATDWSWGALFFDADNDGFNDIYVCNGVNKDVTNLDFMDFFANDIIQKMVMTGKKESVDEVLKKIPRTPLLNKAYRNLGNLQFSDAGKAWGFTQPSFSNGAAYGDLDNDGALDLVINNENQPAFIYRNNSREISKNHYIALLLKGRDKNTFAIGSQIRVYAGGQILCREVVPSRGFQSSVDYKVIIGLGASKDIDSMTITWPDRTLSRYFHPIADTLHLIREPAGGGAPPLPLAPLTRPTNAVVATASPATDPALTRSPAVTPASTRALPTRPAAPAATHDLATPLLQPVSSSFDQHREDSYTDFHSEHNLPRSLSREGPRAAVGDVNGDGLADIFIGGATGQGGQLYLQTPSGGFVKRPEKAFEQFSDIEDVAVLLFDCDHDGDLDLLVCPGGNNAPSFSRQMQLRLYRNDGKGNFELDPSAFPNTGMNVSVAIAEDFNHDGFPDLFIGGRSTPQSYGSTPTSYLFVNDGKGHFTDIAAAKNPDIAHIGMVTGAVWADILGDGHSTGDHQKQLVITGEWMSPRVFSYTGDHFSEVPTNLGHLFGWWQTVAAADLNGDGKMDLILGNIGENFYLHPDSAHPVREWVSDFDRNGITDNILTRSIDGRDMPVFLKHEMEGELPTLKRQNLKHAEYAKKSVRELFPPAQLDSAQVRLFNYPTSIIAFNQGNGQFDIQPLPARVQLSSVNAIQCVDINGDGFPDLVLGGNEFGFLPQFGRLDASFGHVLLNDGKGKFQWLEPGRSGLDLGGQIRDITRLTAKDHVYLLFLRNDEFPAMYRLNQKTTNSK